MMGTLAGAGEGGGGSEIGTLKEVKISDGGRLLKLLGRVGKPAQHASKCMVNTYGVYQTSLTMWCSELFAPELVLARACCTVEQRQTS